MSKQTAAEWIVEQLAPSVSLQQKYIDELLEQAKAMEKEQIEYSEEDMRKIIFTSFLLGVDRGNYSKELEDKLFEQFKKK